MAFSINTDTRERFTFPSVPAAQYVVTDMKDL